jgi:hypothetical protein
MLPSWILPTIIVLALIAGAVWWFRRKYVPSGWIIGPIVHGKNYSENMPFRPTATPTGWAFTLLPGQQVDAVDRDTGPLSGEVYMRFRLINDQGATLRPFEKPTDGSDSDWPALVSLYFQRKGDDWTGEGKYEMYRWYCRPVLLLNEGQGELRVPFKPGNWFAVMGTAADAQPEAFATALREVSRIGLTFGGPAGRSHGVITDKPVTFELLEWKVG